MDKNPESMSSLSQSLLKTRLEKNISKDRQSTRSIRYFEEEEKIYRFLYQVEENSFIKNKKKFKRGIEFLDEKLKKPYNEIIEWNLIESKETQDQNNTDTYF